MATALGAIGQLTTCLLDCADTSDFLRRREIAVGDFCRQLTEGLPCLGPFTEGDTFFPVYGPLLFASWDVMMGGHSALSPPLSAKPRKKRASASIPTRTAST